MFDRNREATLLLGGTRADGAASRAGPRSRRIEARAVSYSKGCYIGQEVINRIHSLGHVNRELVGLRLADDLKTLPARGDKLFKDGKEVGHVTSTTKSPTLKANIALGYVRREVNAVGTELELRSASNNSRVRIVELQFGD